MGVDIILVALIAIVPTVFYVLFVRWLDRYEREPPALLAAAFLWGAVPAVIGSLIIEIIVGVPLNRLFSGLLSEITQSSAIAPVVEETVKAVGLLALLFFFRGEFDDALDGVIYGALVGFGFAMTENFFYFLGTLDQSGLRGVGELALLRIGLFGTTHAFFTGVTGAGLGYARSTANRRRGRVVAVFSFGMAIAFHALHNLGASIASRELAGVTIALLNIVTGLLLLCVIVVWALAQERRWIANELREEIGVSITPGEYELLTRKRSLLVKKAGPLACVAGRRTYLLAELARLATELAFKKHQARAGAREDQQAILQLRSQLAALRRAAADLRPTA